MLQQQKKAVPNLFCVFPGFVKQLPTAFQPCREHRKITSRQRLATALFLSKRFRKGLKNIFLAVQKTTSPINKTYRKGLASNQLLEIILWL